MVYDKVFLATWVSDDGKRYFSAEARRLGYLSATGWKAKTVSPTRPPCLRWSCRRSVAVAAIPAPILPALPNDEYDYAADFYSVFPEADTVAAPKGRKSRKSVIAGCPSDAAETASKLRIVGRFDPNTDLSSFFSPESTSPYDVGFSSKAIPSKDLATSR